MNKNDNVKKAMEEMYQAAVKCYNKEDFRKTLEILQRMEQKFVKTVIPIKYQWNYGQLLVNTLGCLNRVEDYLHLTKQLLVTMPQLSHATGYHLIYSNYLMYSHYRKLGARENYENHKKYGELFAHIPPLAAEKRRRSTGEKIRIGYLSSNFCDHIVLNFSIQLYAAYDRSRYEVFLYDWGDKNDEVTEWLKGMADDYCPLQELSLEESAKKIYADKIDILVDLAGHTEGARGLRIMAYRPAPIQISGIGYFDTTGMPQVDYFLSDVYLDPPANDAYFVEQLIRLPHTHFCYTPPEKILQCKKEWQPKDTITFGSFNQFQKITEEQLLLWREILRQVPNSRLLLKNVRPEKSARDDMKHRLKRLGFSMDAVEIRGPSYLYLEEYSEIDIALDTYPYPGGGTTCETIYMGVPVITRYDNSHHSRFGYSLLQNIGIGELAAATDEEYVEKAVSLAKDRELLQLLHQNLRQMMQQSPVMQAKQYVADVENAYEQVFAALQ